MTSALVVGGGPAGSALAIKLATAGRDVVLLERDRAASDKVCGEFLSREAGLYIAALGIDLAKLGAVPVDSVSLCASGQSRPGVSVSLPFAATSLSRRVLDEALLERAESAGVSVKRGVLVREISKTKRGWCARTADETSIDADAVFLATGKHDIRSHKRGAGFQSDLVAFKMHWRLTQSEHSAIERRVELILFDGGYAGLQPIENDRANLCLVVRRERLRALGQRWEGLLAAIRIESPHLDARLAGAEACWPKPLALSAIPYGHLRWRSDGLWRLGDQAAVIPSFSGDGISIALHSAEVAAATFLRDGANAADRYQKRLARDVALQLALATTVSQALVRRSGQTLLSGAARMWPALASTLAFHTRVPERALNGAGLAASRCGV